MTLARETHFHDPGGAQAKIQIGFSYSDGFGREIQKKIQAEPEKVRRVVGPRFNLRDQVFRVERRFHAHPGKRSAERGRDHRRAAFC